jgi:hypothetical protein
VVNTDRCNTAQLICPVKVIRFLLLHPGMGCPFQLTGHPEFLENERTGYKHGEHPLRKAVFLTRQRR